jgi:hypothetical protein
MTRKQAYESGKQAYRDGLSVYALPFGYINPLAIEWIWGWNCESELKQEQP